jgi:PDZ domain-containing protein
MDLAEECQLDIGSGPQEFRFWVIDLAENMPSDIDGLVSWKDAGKYVIGINLENLGWGFLKELPKDLEGWTKWKIMPDSEFLAIEWTNGTESTKIAIDTGSTRGVELSPERWRAWRAERASKPATLIADFIPADGMVVRQALRAQKIRIGGLDLVDVPVTVVSSSTDALFGHCDATLGLYALRQLRLLIDARRGDLYLSKASSSTNQFPYNKLAAVFVPKDFQRSDDLIAHVVVGGPAYRAGIRDGDVLLKIGALNAGIWRTDPHILTELLDQHAGTKINLTLRRDVEQYETSVTLEELPTVE